MTIHNTPIDLTGMETSVNTEFVKPERKYEEANDQHVRTVVLYANASHALFIDSNKTKAISADEAARLYFNGIKIFDDGKYLNPVSYELDGTTAKFVAGGVTYTA